MSHSYIGLKNVYQTTGNRIPSQHSAWAGPGQAWARFGFDTLLPKLIGQRVSEPKYCPRTWACPPSCLGKPNWYAHAAASCLDGHAQASESSFLHDTDMQTAPLCGALEHGQAHANTWARPSTKSLSAYAPTGRLIRRRRPPCCCEFSLVGGGLTCRLCCPGHFLIRCRRAASNVCMFCVKMNMHRK